MQDVRAPSVVPDGLSAGGRIADWVAQPPGYVALDVDGTLVRDDQVPSQGVLDAVAALVATGTAVGVATGRMAASADPLLATGVFSGPHVFHNGALVTDGSGVEQVVLGLTGAEVDAVLGLGRGRDDLAVEVYVGRTYLCDRDDARSAPHARLLGVPSSGSIASTADLEGRAAVKAVIVCYEPGAVPGVVQAVRALGLEPGPASSPATPGLRYVNVTRSGVDKGSGVAAAAGILGVALPRVATLGDERNDLPAFARAGTAIAMGGSSDEVSAAAHLVAPGFDDDGAAVALRALARLARRT